MTAASIPSARQGRAWLAGPGPRQGRAWLAGGAVTLLGVAAVFWTVWTTPRRNNDDAQVDAIVVLGSPTELDGSVSAFQRWRVDEAVREYRAGRAPYLLMSGGAGANQFAEAHTMARYAMSLGVPPGAILEERTSKNTLQNIRESQRILDEHGWRHVEVISTADHLPRAAVLLAHTHLLWRTHAAPAPGRNRAEAAIAYAEEAFGTALIRWFGLRVLPVLHAIAVVQEAIAFAARWVFYKAQGWLQHR